MNTSFRRSSGSEDRSPASGRIPGSHLTGRGRTLRALTSLALGAALLLAAAHPCRAAQDQGPAPAGPTSPPWYELYRKAVADAELENWEGVAAKIQQALKANPKSERNVRTYGMWHALYIPYYYLGLAQFHMGQKPEALKSLQKEEAAGVIQHDPIAYLKLRKTAAAIGTSPAPGAAAPAATISTAGSSPPAKPPAAPMGDNLVEGLQSFFQGEYDRSILAFQEEMKRSPKDDLTLHLYLGMAYAGKASEASASQKAIWRNFAMVEFQRVHEADPSYTLASGVFSEEMVQLFNEAQKKK